MSFSYGFDSRCFVTAVVASVVCLILIVLFPPASPSFQACKHLPSPVLDATEDRRAMLLSSAASTFELLGDKRHLHDCQALMARQGSAAPLAISSMFKLGAATIAASAQESEKQK